MAEYNESQIQSNETQRIAQETERINNEARRNTNETERQAREDIRIANENNRVTQYATFIQEANTNEQTRQANEQARVNAESQRVTEHAGREVRLTNVEESYGILQAKTAYTFSHENKNGYYILPGGLILQWGSVEIYFNGSTNLVANELQLNTPFSTKIMYSGISVDAFGSDAGPTASSSDIYAITYGDNISKLSYEVRSINEANPVGTVKLLWIAIGI